MDQDAGVRAGPPDPPPLGWRTGYLRGAPTNCPIMVKTWDEARHQPSFSINRLVKLMHTANPNDPDEPSDGRPNPKPPGQYVDKYSKAWLNVQKRLWPDYGIEDEAVLNLFRQPASYNHHDGGGRAARGLAEHAIRSQFAVTTPLLVSMLYWSCAQDGWARQEAYRGPSAKLLRQIVDGAVGSLVAQGTTVKFEGKLTDGGEIFPMVVASTNTVDMRPILAALGQTPELLHLSFMWDRLLLDPTHHQVGVVTTGKEVTSVGNLIAGILTVAPKALIPKCYFLARELLKQWAHIVMANARQLVEHNVPAAGRSSREFDKNAIKAS
jgi:hypothetical protein